MDNDNLILKSVPATSSADFLADIKHQVAAKHFCNSGHIALDLRLVEHANTEFIFALFKLQQHLHRKHISLYLLAPSKKMMALIEFTQTEHYFFTFESLSQLNQSSLGDLIC